MGDAADDVYDAEMRLREAHMDLILAGCFPCRACDGAGFFYVGPVECECEKCQGFGWFDKFGKPCET